MPLDLHGVDEVFHPRLKLFLSADIIGSTAYKQPLDILHDNVEGHARWAKIIQAFYKIISDAFSEHWGDASILLTDHGETVHDRLLGGRPRFWKTIGDEVVFWKELENSLQIWMTIAAWLRTIEKVRNYFESVDAGSANILDVKSSIWLAEFPVRNKPILDVMSSSLPKRSIVERLRDFYDKGDDASVADFIGPGIDVGFRISGLASARKLSVSLDLAYALAVTEQRMSETVSALKLETKDFFPSKDGLDASDFTDKLKIHYSGSEQLKGVLGGVRYPRFWISCVRHGSLEEAKVRMYSNGHGRDVDWTRLKKFCNEFYKDRRKFVSKPFILNDELMGEYPSRYREFLDEAIPEDDD